MMLQASARAGVYGQLDADFAARKAFHGME
jgi:hypothetical protein